MDEKEMISPHMTSKSWDEIKDMTGPEAALWAKLAGWPADLVLCVREGKDTLYEATQTIDYVIWNRSND